ncbi:MAG: flippase-like domain-containing protein [Thermoleophilia bacterium]|nr:flippase-like domain-containing protein [Thermoleophilia bacterium]
MSDLEHVTPSRGRGGALLALGIASSVFFLWLVFRDADLDAVWAALRAADVAMVVLAAVVVQVVYVAQGARWRIIADTLGLTVKRFYALVLGGIGANNILPLRIGDLLRARWLAKAAAIPSGRAFGSVVRDRACDVITLVVALAVSLPIVGDAAWVDRIAIGGIALVAVLALVIGGAVVYTRTRPRARRESRGRARRLLRDTVDEVASPIGRRRLVAALALSVVAWGFWAVAAGLVCRSLGFSLSPIELVFVTAVINLGVVIPSSPGFIGTYQWLAVSALGVVGVDGEVAIAFSLLMQAIWFIPTTIVGGVIVVREVHRDARRQPAEQQSGRTG